MEDIVTKKCINLDSLNALFVSVVLIITGRIKPTTLHSTALSPGIAQSVLENCHQTRIEIITKNSLNVDLRNALCANLLLILIWRRRATTIHSTSPGLAPSVPEYFKSVDGEMLTKNSINAD